MVPVHLREDPRLYAGRTALIAAGLLALGLVLAGVAAGAFFYAAQSPRGVVQVTGAGTIPFESDEVKWTLTLMRRVPPGDILSGYGLLKSDMDRLRTALAAVGLSGNDLVVQPVSMEPWYAERGEVGSYMARQTVSVISNQVDLVEGLAREPGGVLGEGAVLQGSQLEYFYSGLTQLKRSLLAEATRDAEARAREIAGDQLGGLLNATAGVFQIREPHSNEVQGYGMYSTATRQKEITVTVRASYSMR
jgi:uncharacterized protein